MIASIGNLRYAIIVILIGVSFRITNAEDALVQGGESPDGRFQVRIYKTGDEGNPSNYNYAVVDAKTGKIIQKLQEGGGIAMYEGAETMSRVIWHRSGSFFALTDHGTRHSIEMYVYEIAPPNVALLKTQDYFQNALGRVGATSVYATSVVQPLRWDKDDLICDLVYDSYAPTGGRSPQYTTEFTLHLEHGPNTASNLMFTKMSAPTSHD